MAAYLDYLLRRTMLLTASHNLKPQKTFNVPTVAALSSGDLKALSSDEKAIRSRGVWQYQCNGLTEVKNVALRDRTHAGDPLRTVFDSIRWGTDVGPAAHVKAFRPAKNGQEQTLKLPLTKGFLLRTYFLGQGTIPETEEPASTSMEDATIWQLAANLSSSFQYIFGYELNDAGVVSPITHPEAESREGWVEMSFSVSGKGQSIRIVQPPFPRILVCLGLGCATERPDFEPGKVLGAARIHPHFMLWANTPLNRMEAEITCARPAKSTMVASSPGKQEILCGSGHSSHGTSVVSGASGSMNDKIEMAFYTDANIPVYLPLGGKPSPYWEALFDYYLVGPSNNESMTIVSSKLTQTRKYQVKMADTRGEHLPAGPVLTFPPPPSAFLRKGLEYSRSKSIMKLPRQGEFDNVHIAPTMRMPKTILAKHPGWKELERIAMAPFCHHDCLHMHWRWGKNAEYPRYSRGWGGTREKPGGPFQAVGAPHVPANQDVFLKMVSATAFVYKAVIHQPQPGVWQTVMHHGAAYSLATDSELFKLLLLDHFTHDDLGGGALAKLADPWPFLYWNLRYLTLIPSSPEARSGAKEAFLERLNLPAPKLKELRELDMFQKLYPQPQVVKKPVVARRPPAALGR